KNIDLSSIMPDHGGTFQMIDQDEIYTRVETQGEFPYLVVSEVVGGKQCVGVSLDYLWASRLESKTAHMDEARIVFEFRKVSGKWKSSTVFTQIS
ncbi:MAG: hypothetical protein AAB288_13865, partial [Acidobacteriota bacterium]